MRRFIADYDAVVKTPSRAPVHAERAPFPKFHPCGVHALTGKSEATWSQLLLAWRLPAGQALVGQAGVYVAAAVYS